MDRSITVTGGAGFIGGHLVRRLLAGHPSRAARGQRITVLDDLSAPSTLPLPRDPRLRLVVGDVRDRAAVLRAGAGAGLVLHLASVVGVDAVTDDPLRTGSVIREGTARVLEHCRRTGAGLLAFSTSEVTDPPRSGPRAVYAEAKRDAEAMLLAAAHELPVTIVRPFNIVGPGQSAPGMVIPALARAARHGAPMPVHGDGSQRRSFLHVDDLVDAVLGLLAQPADASGAIIEIGSEQRVSIAALAEALASMAGSAARPARMAPDARREDRPRRGPDLNALRQRTRFKPQRDLEQILQEALAHA